MCTNRKEFDHFSNKNNFPGYFSFFSSDIGQEEYSSDWAKKTLSDLNDQTIYCGYQGVDRNFLMQA